MDTTTALCTDCKIGFYSNANTNGQCKICKFSFYPGAASCLEGFVQIIAGKEVSPEESKNITKNEFVYTNGSGPKLCLNNPRAIANDKNGNIYFTESMSVVRKLSLIDYSVSTITKDLVPDGDCALDGLAVDPKNQYIYVSSCQLVRRITIKTGDISLISDNLKDRELFGGSISMSSSGKYLYRATGTPMIRQIDTSKPPYEAASLLLPTSDTELDAESRTFSLAISSSSEYLFEVGYNGVVNRLDPKGAFETIAGSINDDAEDAIEGQGTAAFMPTTACIVADVFDNLYITDPGALYLHKVSSSGSVITLVDMIRYFNASLFAAGLNDTNTDSYSEVMRKLAMKSRRYVMNDASILSNKFTKRPTLALAGGIDDPRVPGSGDDTFGSSSDDGADTAIDVNLLAQVSPWGITTDSDGRVYFTTGGVCGSVRMLSTSCPSIDQYVELVDSNIVCKKIPEGIVILYFILSTYCFMSMLNAISLMF